MRVVIIPGDRLVRVDGFTSENVDLSCINNNVHAVQWFGDSGWVEYLRDAAGRKPANTDLTEFSEYQRFVDVCLQHKEEADARALLEQAGGLPDVESVRKLAQGELTRTDWTQLPDVNLTNKAAFAQYRDWCRQMYFNPLHPDDPNFVLMESPEPVWADV